MSLQDDYYDLRDFLKGKPEAEMLERIWLEFCDLETQEMVRRGEFTERQYMAWKADILKRKDNA